MAVTRTESDVSRVFVALAGGLAGGDDVVELLTTLTGECARLLDVASTGLLLADRRAVLHVMAASSERTRELEVFQLQRDEGPCRDSYVGGTAISVPDLAAETGRWPQFAPHALAAGFTSVHALPMRLGGAKLGTLGLFGTSVGDLRPADLSLGQALADVASIAIVQDRTSSSQTSINTQLQRALTSRVVLEQAKGVLAQQGSLEMPDAYSVLQRYARDHDRRLTELAGAVVARQLPGRLLLDHAQAAAATGQT